MNDSNKQKPLVTTAARMLKTAHRFAQNAMATTFEIFIIHDDKKYARQAANAAFRCLQKLEAKLSRFIPESEISQINNLQPKEKLVLELDAFKCLSRCKQIYQQTNHAFDVTASSLYEIWFTHDRQLKKPSFQQIEQARSRTGMNLINLDEQTHTVTLETPVHVDLGGFGKGYAIDRMAQTLREWSVNVALIHGGTSSVLALDPPLNSKGWPVSMTDPENHKKVLAELKLNNYATGASALETGPHIIDPRKGWPVKGKIAAWSAAPQAATADALSTAFMIMSPDQIRSFCKKHQRTKALVILSPRKESSQRSILHFGNWKNEQLLYLHPQN